MKIVYIDESGNTGSKLTDPKEPYHIMAALLVDEKYWEEAELYFNQILKDFIPENKRKQFCFHATDLFCSKNIYQNWENIKKDELVRRMLSILKEFDINITCSIIDKPKLKAKYSRPKHPHDLAFLLVAERIERYLKEKEPNNHAIIFCHRYQERAKQLKADLKFYRKVGVDMGLAIEPLNHIIETIAFVHSRDYFFIQVADFCAYIIRLNRLSPQNTTYKKFFINHIKNMLYNPRVFPS